MQSYPSDLTDAEWCLLEPLIPPPKTGGSPRTTDMRQICNAIFFVLAIPGVTCPMTLVNGLSLLSSVARCGGD
ncbi:MAG: transposase [Synechococcaceae cyanobacterium SM2_3_2]|nr:transposase [Synechococcaceae cyanobacterium SM2_3_2]